MLQKRFSSVNAIDCHRVLAKNIQHRCRLAWPTAANRPEIREIGLEVYHRCLVVQSMIDECETI